MLWFLASPLAAQHLADCGSDNFDILPDTTEFCVLVNVKDGYLSVVPNSAHIKIVDGFWPNQPGDEMKVIAEITSYVEKIAHRRRIYTYGVRSATQSAPPDSAVHFDADSMDDAVAKLKSAWPDCDQCDSILDRVLGDLANGLVAESPLSNQLPFADSSLRFSVDGIVGDVSAIPVTFDLGTATFATNGRLLSGASVHAWLARFQNRFWIQKEIHDYYQSWYSDLALSPEVMVSGAGQDRMVRIKESDRLGRILLPAAAGNKLDDDGLKLAYLLLDTKQYGNLSKAKLHPIKSAGTVTSLAICLPELQGHACTPPPVNPQDPGEGYPEDDDEASRAYLDSLDLADKQAAVASLGYSFSLVNESKTALDTRPTVDLLVQKMAPPAKPSQSGTDAAAPKPNPEARLKTNQSGMHQQHRIVNDQPARMGEPLHPAPANTVPAPSPLSRMSWMFGVSYRPGQSVRGVVSGSLPDLHLGGTPSAFSGTLGGDSTHLIGSATFNLDFLGFPTIGRRLSLQSSGASDVTSQRLLGGVAADERRSGGTIAAAMDIFHNISQFFLGITADAGSQEVTLSLPASKSDSATLIYIQPGADFRYASVASRMPVRLEVKPSVKLAHSNSPGGGVYQVWTVEGGMHARIWNQQLITADISGAASAASSRTPIYELPSLGGSDSLRGFRADLALGRKRWSIQPELWAPIPGSVHGEGAVRKFLRKQFRLAAFFDAGAVSDTGLASTPAAATIGALGSQPGFRRGPGAGIRLLQGAVAVKIDWAYGLGAGLAHTGRSQFYIGVAKNGAF
jgi:hypothetical protein